MADAPSNADIAAMFATLSQQIKDNNTQIELMRTENAELRQKVDDIATASTVTETERRVHFNTTINPMQSLETDDLHTPATRVSEVQPNTNTVSDNAGANAHQTMEVEPSPPNQQNSSIPDYAKRLTEIENMVGRIPGYPNPVKKTPANSFADSPFVDSISLIDMPRKFHLPSFKMYDGTSDPDDHMAQYKQRMFTTSIPVNIREAVMCKGFGASLSGPALQWYTNLSNSSISSFSQLNDFFVEQFASSRKIEKRSDDLYAISQRRGESLREFVARFNKEKVSITNCNVDTTISAFRKGLRHDSDLYKELTKYPCKTMEDVLSKAWAQIKWEEDEGNRSSYYSPMRKESKPQRTERYHPYSRPDKTNTNVAYDKRQSRDRTTERQPTIPPTPRRIPDYNLCISPVEAVDVLKQLGPAVKWPAKLKSPADSRDKNKFCNFHNDHGHNTEDCIALRIEVVELLKKGHLNDLLSAKGKETWGQKDKAPAGGTTLALPNPPRHDKTVNCITGGDDLSGTTSSSAKRNARAAMQQTHGVNLVDNDQTILSFSSSEALDLYHPHHDALIISLMIANCLTKRILIDNGSSTNVIFLDVLKEMQISESCLVRRITTLKGFSGEVKSTLGEITLPVYAEGMNMYTKFSVVDCKSEYNMILGRPWIHAMKAVPSTYHQCIKFPTPWGNKEIKGDQLTSRSCYKSSFRTNTMQVQEVDCVDKLEPTEPEFEDLEQVQIDPDDTDRVVFIGSLLGDDMRKALIEFLTKNKDVFAWSHADMTGVDPEVITHHLNADPDHPPVRQKRRKFAHERNDVIDEEVRRLLDNGLIREVQYPEWLANVVVVRKKNGKWRICIDFTDLNEACPKDSFPLPHIDIIVDATAGHEMMSFMDAFSGYNQILMHPADQEKTAFVTNKGTFCFKVMPFGLKNAGATYQRLVNQMFSDMLGKTMEVYIDDMLVKSLRADDHISHLAQAFEVLRKYNMKLNPSKCSFGVTSGKFLGYLVTKRGIEAHPDQIKSISKISSPKNVKEVQRLTGRLAALSRFISRYSERSRLFFNTLKKVNDFKWTPECEEALGQLKKYLSSPPVLSKPTKGETLHVYLAVSSNALSAVLTREEDGRQHPVYYVSRTLLDPETRYTTLEKLALALVMAGRKLRPYFQAYPIKVVTNFPLKTILHKPDVSGRLAKWAVELSEYDIQYVPRLAIKSQVIADFIADFSADDMQKAECELADINKGDREEIWNLEVDGSSNGRGSGLGVVLVSPEGDKIVRAIRLGFKTTNNEAEYESLIAGLTLANDMSIRHVKVKSDSQLIVSQVNNDFQAKDNKMAAYLQKVNDIKKDFKSFEIIHVPREDNHHADALANLGSAVDTEETTSIPLTFIQWPAIWKQPNSNDITMHIVEETTWMTPIMKYLADDYLPDDKAEARKIKIRAARFSIIKGVLFKRSYSGPYLRCVSPTEAKNILAEMHEGECGNHSGGRSLTNRCIRAGYFWPTLRSEAKDHVKNCDKCQRFATTCHLHPEPLHPTITPWPFMKWGMDIVGKLPPAPGQRVFMLALTDYFSKWVEAEAFQRVRDREVKNFVWKNIICRFGVPAEIVTDNGPQFISFEFQDFCKEWGIKLTFSTPRYPQANGQAESSNKTIMNTMKKRLSSLKGRWADDLPSVLWSYRTTARSSTGETPFSLVYGSEAVIPAEIGVHTARTLLTTPESNDEEMSATLDTIDEIRDRAAIRMANYQQQVARHYNKHLRLRSFQVNDWVLRRVFQNTKDQAAGKLAPNWEGPYLITKINGHGAYKLRTKDGRDIGNSWNAVHLRQYHF